MGRCPLGRPPSVGVDRDGNRGSWVGISEISAYFGWLGSPSEEWLLVGSHTRVVKLWQCQITTWLINSIKQGKALKVLTDQYVSPTLNTNLAEMLLEIAERRITGTLHTAGPSRVSRYHFAIKLARILLDKLFSSKVIKNASRIIALTNAEAKELERIGITKEHIIIVPNGIILEDYWNLPLKDYFKKQYNVPKGKKIILYLGRLNRTKEIELLIRAYARLIIDMEYNESVLVVAGPDDGYLSEAKYLAGSLGISKSLLFTGFLSTEDKFKALVDAEILVIPCFFGFPITFLEACVAGVPIITTNLGDTLNWMENGVDLVTHPNSADLANAIYQLLSNKKLVALLKKAKSTTP